MVNFFFFFFDVCAQRSNKVTFLNDMAAIFLKLNNLMNQKMKRFMIFEVTSEFNQGQTEMM